MIVNPVKLTATITHYILLRTWSTMELQGTHFLNPFLLGASLCVWKDQHAAHDGGFLLFKWMF